MEPFSSKTWAYVATCCLFLSLIIREHIISEVIPLCALSVSFMALWLGLAKKHHQSETDVDYLAKLIQRQAVIITKQEAPKNL